MWRRFERARGEDDREVDAEAGVVDPPQVGDLRGDLAAQHIDGQRVAGLQPHAGGQRGVERDQRGAAVIRRPPCAGDDLGARRNVGRVGQATVAAQRPLRIGRDRRVLDRDAVEAGDAAAQHRHLGRTGDCGTARTRLLEPGELVGLDVDKKISGRVLGEPVLDLEREIAFDESQRAHHAEPDAERQHDPRGRRPRPVQITEREA